MMCKLVDRTMYSFVAVVTEYLGCYMTAFWGTDRYINMPQCGAIECERGRKTAYYSAVQTLHCNTPFYGLFHTFIQPSKMFEIFWVLKWQLPKIFGSSKTKSGNTSLILQFSILKRPAIMHSKGCDDGPTFHTKHIHHSVSYIAFP